MWQIRRHEGGLLVGAPVGDVVYKLKSGHWGWTTRWGSNPDGAVTFEVKGSFFKDNAAAAIFEVRPLGEDQTDITVEGWKGSSMNALGGNVFNVGVKKFQQKAIEKATEILRA